METSVYKFNDIKSAFTADHYWKVVSETEFAVVTAISTRTVQLGDLKKMHPLLPACIKEHILRYQQLFKQSSMQGFQVEDVLHLLQHGSVDLVDTKGNNIVLLDVAKLAAKPDAPDEVEIQGTDIEITYGENFGEVAPIVKITNWDTHNVYKSDLDARYPGWETKWRVGVELGVENNELMHNIFSRAALLPTPEGMVTIGFE